MKLRSRWLTRCLALFGALLLRLWLCTLRYRVASLGAEVHPVDPRRRRFLYAFWHETLLSALSLRRRVHVLISRHRDGELIARICLHLGIGTVRGSSGSDRRGGATALREMAHLAGRTHLAVTPDGPRGPRRVVQPGLILLASRTGLPVVPLGVGWSHAWRARSWDRFAVPLPFSSACCVFGAEIHVPPRLDRGQLERYRLLVEGEMLRATAAAERWAARGGRVQVPAAAKQAA